MREPVNRIILGFGVQGGGPRGAGLLQHPSSVMPVTGSGQSTGILHSMTVLEEGVTVVGNVPNGGFFREKQWPQPSC